MPNQDFPALLGDAIIGSKIFKIMVVDADMNVVWVNEAHASMFNGEELIGRKCYETLGSEKIHAGCPTCISLKTGKTATGLYNFGPQNALIITLPLPGGFVAKVMLDAPQDADGQVTTI
jgi:hypothetical protein